MAYLLLFLIEIQVGELSSEYPIKRNGAAQVEAEVPVINLDQRDDHSACSDKQMHIHSPRSQLAC